MAWTWQAYPPTVNDGNLLQLVRRTSERLVGPEKWHTKEKHILGAEDFAFYTGKAIAFCLSDPYYCPNTNG